MNEATERDLGEIIVQLVDRVISIESAVLGLDKRTTKTFDEGKAVSRDTRKKIKVLKNDIIDLHLLGPDAKINKDVYDMDYDEYMGLTGHNRL